MQAPGPGHWRSILGPDVVDLVVMPGDDRTAYYDGEAVANALCVNGAVLIADGFPRTAALLARRGHDVRTLKLDEVMKLDAGLSCMSLRWTDSLTLDA